MKERPRSTTVDEAADMMEADDADEQVEQDATRLTTRRRLRRAEERIESEERTDGSDERERRSRLSTGSATTRNAVSSPRTTLPTVRRGRRCRCRSHPEGHAVRVGDELDDNERGRDRRTTMGAPGTSVVAPHDAPTSGRRGPPTTAGDRRGHGLVRRPRGRIPRGHRGPRRALRPRARRGRRTRADLGEYSPRGARRTRPS